MGRTKFSLKNKLIILVMVATIPLLCITVYLIVALTSYSSSYDRIVTSMTIANSYNLNFKEELDESIYKLAVGCVTFENISEDASLQNPYELIADLRSDFQTLMQITTDKESRAWLQSLLRNIDTLEERVDDIKENLEEGGHYDENMEMLDNNIYILTELIQDDIQYYIYYQTQSIENLRDQLNSQVQSFVTVCCMALVFVVAGVLITAVLISNSITKPVEELCGVTDKISKGDFSVRAGVTTEDEVAQLAGRINHMSEQLEIMVDKIKEDERKMRYAELRLLQEQINPHFLYNTLDTIVWLIECNLSEKAMHMVVSLSDFFRLVLSHGKEFISIQDEERHIRSYLEIQQVRYCDILEYEIAIEPELYQYKILKLSLQPIVENALYHGIKYKRAKGKIEITGTMRNEKIYLAVKDTGVGMSEEQLQKLREDIKQPCKETEAGFGLANVNERIRIHFGAEYGMTIDSVEGEGTTVSLVIPAEFSEAQKGQGDE